MRKPQISFSLAKGSIYFVGFYYYSNDNTVFESLFARSTKQLAFLRRFQAKTYLKFTPKWVSARLIRGGGSPAKVTSRGMCGGRKHCSRVLVSPLKVIVYCNTVVYRLVMRVMRITNCNRSPETSSSASLLQKWTEKLKTPAKQSQKKRKDTVMS
jgi:hypothetical protein